MTITGSCLCGSVTFECDAADGPFEICHCNRCRKLTGSVGMPAFSVKKSHFRMLTGRDNITVWYAPILRQPPAYISPFCRTCGSPVPMDFPEYDDVEIPAGLVDGDPGIKPDKHILVEQVPAWDSITDGLPTFTLAQIYKHRTGKEPPD